jgi:hypothetical protein
MDLKERDWEIARAVKDPDRVRELLSQGHKPDAFDLCEAARHGALCAGAVETVENLLATSDINANARPDYADLTNTAGVEGDWASSAKSSLPPQIYKDPDEWYPLHLALTYSRVQSDPHVQKKNMTRMATALLQQGADPYALFARQSGPTTIGRTSLVSHKTTKSSTRTLTWESSNVSVEMNVSNTCSLNSYRWTQFVPYSHASMACAA